MFASLSSVLSKQAALVFLGFKRIQSFHRRTEIILRDTRRKLLIVSQKNEIGLYCLNRREEVLRIAEHHLGIGICISNGLRAFVFRLNGRTAFEAHNVRIARDDDEELRCALCGYIQ